MQAAQEPSEFESWGFGADSFTVVPAASTQNSRPINEGNSSQNYGGTAKKVVESNPVTQPAGWAGF